MPQDSILHHQHDFSRLIIIDIGLLCESNQAICSASRLEEQCPATAADKVACAQVIGETATELDGRFSTVRLKESNLGNWVADIWRAAARADIALLNSGTLRSDCLHAAGPLTMKARCAKRLHFIHLCSTALYRPG